MLADVGLDQVHNTAKTWNRTRQRAMLDRREAPFSTSPALHGGNLALLDVPCNPNSSKAEGHSPPTSHSLSHAESQKEPPCRSVGSPGLLLRRGPALFPSSLFWFPSADVADQRQRAKGSGQTKLRPKPTLAKNQVWAAPISLSMVHYWPTFRSMPPRSVACGSRHRHVLFAPRRYRSNAFIVVGSRTCVDNCCTANCLSGLQGAMSVSFPTAVRVIVTLQMGWLT